MICKVPKSTSQGTLRPPVMYAVLPEMSGSENPHSTGTCAFKSWPYSTYTNPSVLESMKDVGPLSSLLLDLRNLSSLELQELA